MGEKQVWVAFDDAAHPLAFPADMPVQFVEKGVYTSLGECGEGCRVRLWHQGNPCEGTVTGAESWKLVLVCTAAGKDAPERVRASLEGVLPMIAGATFEVHD